MNQVFFVRGAWRVALIAAILLLLVSLSMVWYQQRSLSDRALTDRADIAEYYYSNTPLDGGTIVTIDAATPGGFIKPADAAVSSSILGVVSTNPYLIMGELVPEISYPVALSGRIVVKAALYGEQIHAGDRLALSSIPGYARKATGAGMIIGYAVTDSPLPEDLPYCPGWPGESEPDYPRCSSVTVFQQVGYWNGN